MKGGESLHRLRHRLSDPLLTALTIMLAVLLFVIGPLQAAGVVAAHHFAIAFGLVLVAAVFIVSESWIAVTAILIAISLIVAATVMRLRQPSVVDIYLDAIAWMITGMTLSVVVARAVFARRTGDVPSHHRGGPALSQYWINLRSAVLLCGASRAPCIHRSWATSGQPRRCR